MTDPVVPEPFRPFLTYIPDGDCIEAFWSSSATKSEHVMPGLTLHRSRETGEVVGVLVDGVEFVKRRKMIMKGEANPMTDQQPQPSRVFRDRLIEARDAHRYARENLSLADLQRETNRLLRLNLMEHQIGHRAAEFENRLYRTNGKGSRTTTFEELLDFQRYSSDAGDEVAVEWARRQLEGHRHEFVSPGAIRRIDAATDRPDRVNPRTVDSHRRSLAGRAEHELEEFAERAIDGKDANACIAAFLMARDTPDGPGYRWVRKVLSGVVRFPEVAISYLLRLEGEVARS